MEYEWDKRKAEANAARHQVTFEEASTAFDDFLSVTVPDPDHSQDEERWITLGYSKWQRLLFVSHTKRGGKTRIISARLPTRYEQQAYREGQNEF